MKVKTVIQKDGREAIAESMEQRIKELWKASGNLAKNLKNVEIYLKPDENMCFYVINDDFKGSFPIWN